MGGIALSSQYHKTINRGYLHIIQKVTQSSLLIHENNSSQSEDQSVHPCPEVSLVFRALSDDKSLTLFNTIALSPGSSDFLTRNLGVTRKQYYSKMNHLSKEGLIARKNGRYYLTTMGKIIYELQSVVGVAVNNYWKLKAIDSLRIQDQLPEDQINKLIYTLVENQDLRDIILKR
jgi:hypothetical protein